jgi:hypothetical protein
MYIFYLYTPSFFSFFFVCVCVKKEAQNEKWLCGKSRYRLSWKIHLVEIYSGMLHKPKQPTRKYNGGRVVSGEERKLSGIDGERFVDLPI